MAGKKKTTFAKLARERKLHEKRAEKKARKDARKLAGGLQEMTSDETYLGEDEFSDDENGEHEQGTALLDAADPVAHKG